MAYGKEEEQLDPYLSWAASLQGQDPARRQEDAWEISLVEPLTPDVFDQIKDDRNLRVDDAEQEYVLRIREVTNGLPPFFLYRRQGYLPPEPFFRVLVRGLPSDDRAYQTAQLNLESEAGPDQPLLAVIDDGLGFLNDRFQRAGVGGWETRIEGVFIQSIKQNPPSASGMAFGRELSRAEVQNLIQRPDERTAYKEINEDVFAADTLRANEQAASHGTHIMDLAGGADPQNTIDPMRDVPMVLVQLPPQIVDDTSGRFMVPHILQALHWILLKAILLGKSRVVVNLSFGITAGPKDGTSLFASHTAFLVNLAALIGIRLDVVVPFGNDYQNRQIATVNVPPQEPAEIDVRLQPDDRAPNYVEIRPDDATAPADIALGLIAPNGDEIASQTLVEGDFRDVVHRGRVVGRVTHVPALQGRLPYLLIALAPTAVVRDDALPANGQGILIEPGNWTIMIEHADGIAADLRLEIQRGDSMPTYRQRGRQAYFSDPHGYEYDLAGTSPTSNPVAAKSYSRLGEDAQITHDGTNSAFTVVPGASGQVHTVGGAFLGSEDTEAVAAQYTSLNTRPGRGTPTGGAQSEHNRALPGLRASGVLSGSTARFAGSSAAAAVYSRNLILQNAPQIDAAAPGRLPPKIYAGAPPRD